MSTDPGVSAFTRLIVGVVIPAFNEEQSIAKVLADIPREFNDASATKVISVVQIIVVDNASTDAKAAAAQKGGALVVDEPHRGYGQACSAGIAALGKCDVVVFLDGDYSDYPEEMVDLVMPIARDEADLVIGSRVLGHHERGALFPQARIGNFLATWLIRQLCGFAYTDLGPFRAIRRKSLARLDMRDQDFGWTVEMQIKAARFGLRVVEVPVSYRKRIGKSKISGTLLGSVRAGHKILSTIYRYAR